MPQQRRRQRPSLRRSQFRPRTFHPPRSRHLARRKSIPGNPRPRRRSPLASELGCRDGRCRPTTRLHFLPATSATLLPCTETDDHRVLNLQNPTGSTTIRAKIVLACDGIAGTLLTNEPWAAWKVDPRGWMGVSTTLPNSFFPPLHVLRGRVGVGVLQRLSNDVQPRAIHMHIAPGGYVGLVRLPDSRIHLAAALNPATCKSAGGPPPLVQPNLSIPAITPPPMISAKQNSAAPPSSPAIAPISAAIASSPSATPADTSNPSPAKEWPGPCWAHKKPPI